LEHVALIEKKLLPQAFEYKTFDTHRLSGSGNHPKDDDTEKVLAVSDLAHVEREMIDATVLLYCVGRKKR
jgi:hypothetical protein